MDRTAIAIFALAAMLRFGLSTGFPGLSPLLVNRVEISTPVTGFKERESYHKIQLYFPVRSIRVRPVYNMFSMSMLGAQDRLATDH